MENNVYLQELEEMRSQVAILNLIDYSDIIKKIRD